MRLIVQGSEFDFYGWDVTCPHCYVHLTDDERNEPEDAITDVPCPACGNLLCVSKVSTVVYTARKTKA